MRPAWQRMTEAGEGEEAFAAFSLYRDLGPERRSITAVAHECHKERALIGRWSARWAWVERVGAYDAWLDAQRVDEQVQQVREMAKRHAQAADYMVALLLQRMATLANGQADEIPVGVLPRWLDVGAVAAPNVTVGATQHSRVDRFRGLVG